MTWLESSVSSYYDFYASDIYSNGSISAAASVSANSIYTNDFYYKTASNVTFHSNGAYHFSFEDSGAYFTHSITGNNNLYINNDIYSDGLSASTLSGDGSAITNVSGTDINYYEYTLDSHEPTGFSPAQRLACSISAHDHTHKFYISPTVTEYHF
jgi:hypothetical protein